MDSLNLEPYTVKLRLSRQENGSKYSYNKTITFFTEHLAQLCMLEKDSLIGHIKGFATDSEGSWLRVSVTDEKHPAHLEGRISGKPEYVNLILNINVLGVPADKIKTLLNDLINNPVICNSVSIVMIPPEGKKEFVCI